MPVSSLSAFNAQARCTPTKDSRLDAAQTPKTGTTLQEYAILHNLPIAMVVESALAKISFDRLPGQVPRISPPSSPPGLSSPSSSPDTATDIWDPPETPCRRSTGNSELGISTPLTPPTPRNVFVEYALLTESDQSSAAVVKHVTKNAQSEESFRPKKLFRIRTSELEAIAKQNRAPALKYNLEPCFRDFTSGQFEPVSFRTRSTTLPMDTKTIEVKTEINQADYSPQIRKRRTKLQMILDHILPLSLHARHKEDKYKCVASKVRNRSSRCSKDARASSDDVKRICRNISACKEENDYVSLHKQIKELVGIVTCSRHTEVADSRIVELQERFPDLSHLSKKDAPNFTEWIDAISNPQSATIHITWSVAKPTKYNRPVPRKATTPSTLTVHLPHTPRFFPFEPEKTRNLPVPQALRFLATKPLTKSELSDGHIYIFWDIVNFGMLKIGKTDNLQRRLAQWNRDCKRKHSYHPHEAIALQIPHVNRVEKLVHAELKEHRRKRKCENCPKTHIEWFDVGEMQAVKVLEKWQKWIMQEPYARDAKTGEWKLRPDMLESLTRACEPVRVEEKKGGRRRKSQGVKSAVEKKPARRTI